MSVDNRAYQIGKFYLVGSTLKFIRHGDDLIIANDFTPDEAAEYLDNLRSKYTGKQEPLGVRIFTSNKASKRKAVNWQSK